MATFESGKVILGVLFWFLLLFSALFIVEWFSSTYGLEHSLLYEGNISDFQLTDFGSCQLPRGFVNPSSGEFEPVPSLLINTLECEFMQGSTVETDCNLIEGCTYENNTFWGFVTGESCNGDVNATYYSIPLEPAPVTHLANGSIRSYIANQSLCELFGYSWSTSESSAVSIGTLFEITGALFTFNVTFTENYFINFLITLALFYIPLASLLVALYYALPFIH